MATSPPSRFRRSTKSSRARVRRRSPGSQSSSTGLPPSAQNTARIKIFFKAWAQFDPTAAFEKATAFHTPETRGNAIEAVIGGADPAASGALADTIAKLPDETLAGAAKANYFSLAVVKWSEVDPAAARLLGQTHLEGMTFGVAFYSVAQSWGRPRP
ncbi:MAG: hypothetical protein ABI540_03365, partial [Spartobacteria bacterium]